MASDNSIPKSRFYLHVTGDGASGLTPSTVFYDVDDEWLAKELCHLFDREYGGDRLSFQYKSSDSIPKVEQILLREALTELSAYGDPDQGIYDPAPPQQSFDRAQYAVRAEGWEQLLNPGTAVTGDTDARQADEQPDPPTEDDKGIAIFDLALLMEEDEAVARVSVKRLINSKKIRAKPIGKCPYDGRRKLYRLSELLSDVTQIMTLNASEEAMYLKGLTAKIRFPRDK